MVITPKTTDSGKQIHKISHKLLKIFLYEFFRISSKDIFREYLTFFVWNFSKNFLSSFSRFFSVFIKLLFKESSILPFQSFIFRNTYFKDHISHPLRSSDVQKNVIFIDFFRDCFRNFLRYFVNFFPGITSLIVSEIYGGVASVISLRISSSIKILKRVH